MYTTIITIGACFGFASLTFAGDDPATWHLEIQTRAHTTQIDLATGEREMVAFDTDLSGEVSPDGRHVVFVASDPGRIEAGHEFDLFIADIDPRTPSRKSNIRRLTTDQVKPNAPVWLPSSQGVAFLAHRSVDDASQAAWAVDLSSSPPAAPARLSDLAAENVWNLSVTPKGEVAFIQLNGRKNKQMHADLMVRRPFPRQEDGAITVRKLVSDQHISSYAFSPDGASLAWSGLGSMFIVDQETSESREIPLHGIHRQLINHTVHELSWRPDGKVIAIRCHFLGGIARGLNSDPSAPWPRMFAEDKILFVPVNLLPTPESLIVGAGDQHPSPTADDPKAEASPPPGDESRPWWIREVDRHSGPMRWRQGVAAWAGPTAPPLCPGPGRRPPQVGSGARPARQWDLRWLRDSVDQWST